MFALHTKRCLYVKVDTDLCLSAQWQPIEEMGDLDPTAQSTYSQPTVSVLFIASRPSQSVFYC